MTERIQGKATSGMIEWLQMQRDFNTVTTSLEPSMQEKRHLKEVAPKVFDFFFWWTAILPAGDTPIDIKTRRPTASYWYDNVFDMLSIVGANQCTPRPIQENPVSEGHASKKSELK